MQTTTDFVRSVLVLAVVLSGATPGLAEDPKLSLPLICEPGKTCFIQSYFDHDPGPGVQDHACGAASYDGHDGIDFRLLSAAETTKNFAVIASADGTVLGTRDGMTDVIVREIGGLASVKDRECGNGVTLDHGNGFETQYCHMLKGSLVVKTGDKVSRGQKLGAVGFSGAADFPHVHLAVRKNGQRLDPYTGTDKKAACSLNAANSVGLWDETAAKAFQYVAGQAIEAGFTSDTAVADKIVSSQTVPIDKPTPTSAALLFFASFINLKAGDSIVSTVTGPGGFVVDGVPKPLDRNKASFVTFAGKKRTTPVWPTGRYNGTAKLMRDGKAVTEISAEFEMK
jgi:Peptidase family M23